MSAARKHYIAGRPERSHSDRVEAMREVAADIFALAERMTCPPRSDCEMAGWRASGKELSSRITAILK